MKYRVLIEHDENGVFVMTYSTLPGCVTRQNKRECNQKYPRGNSWIFCKFEKTQ